MVKSVTEVTQRLDVDVDVDVVNIVDGINLSHISSESFFFFNLKKVVCPL